MSGEQPADARSLLTSERTWASAPFEDPDPDPDPEPPEDVADPPPPLRTRPYRSPLFDSMGFGAAFGLAVRFGLAEAEGDADGLGEALAFGLPEGEASGDALPAAASSSPGPARSPAAFVCTRSAVSAARPRRPWRG